MEEIERKGLWLELMVKIYFSLRVCEWLDCDEIRYQTKTGRVSIYKEIGQDNHKMVETSDIHDLFELIMASD